MISSKEKNKYLGNLAEMCGRITDSLEYCLYYIENTQEELNDDDTHLIALCFHCLVNEKRANYRTILAYEVKNKSRVEFIDWILEYKRKIQEEIETLCNQYIWIIETYLIPKTTTLESELNFKRSIANYLRYIIESLDEGEKREKIKTKLDITYKEIEQKSNNLPIINAINLGLILSECCFKYEVLNETDYAFNLATRTIEKVDKCIDDLNKLDEDHRRDVESIINLLKENIEMWQKEREDL